MLSLITISHRLGKILMVFFQVSWWSDNFLIHCRMWAHITTLWHVFSTNYIVLKPFFFFRLFGCMFLDIRCCVRKHRKTELRPLNPWDAIPSLLRIVWIVPLHLTILQVSLDFAQPCRAVWSWWNARYGVIGKYLSESKLIINVTEPIVMPLLARNLIPFPFLSNNLLLFYSFI